LGGHKNKSFSNKILSRIKSEEEAHASFLLILKKKREISQDLLYYLYINVLYWSGIEIDWIWEKTKKKGEEKTNVSHFLLIIAINATKPSRKIQTIITT